MTEMVITRGIPGSGKSTWAKEWVAQDPENRVRANRDGIRWTQGIQTGIGTPAQEEIVTEIERAIVVSALKSGKSVVIDAMNLNDRFVRPWFKIADRWGAEVVFQDFPTPVRICISWDFYRGMDGGREVGKKVIQQIARKFKVQDDGTLPKAPKWAPKPVLSFNPAPPYDESKIDAIIVDVDNTLAHMKGRGPYETSKYHTDTLDEAVARIVNALDFQYHILVTSGRSEDFRQVTSDWLVGHNVRFDGLFMRKSGDMRNDSIVKHDLFHEFIAPTYNVVMAFDDRDRVVKAWRDMGIKTAQVEYGDF